MRTNLSRTARIVAFVLATLGATGALVAAGVNETSPQNEQAAAAGCGPSCGSNAGK
jgi:hypothetical protein